MELGQICPSVVVFAVLVSVSVELDILTTRRTTTLESPSENHTSTLGCQANLTCDLDHAPYFCGFRGSSGSNRNMWLRTNNQEEIRHHRGYYFLAAKSRLDPGRTANLTTTPLCPAISVNVSFSYITVRPNTELHVLTRCQGQSQVIDQRSVQYSSYSSRFFRFKGYTMWACPDANTSITFQAVLPLDSWRKTSLALDNIVIKMWNGTLPTTPPPTLSPPPSTTPQGSGMTTPSSMAASLTSFSFFPALYMAVTWLTWFSL